MWHINPNATLNWKYCVVVLKIPHSLDVWSLFGHDCELDTHKQWNLARLVVHNRVQKRACHNEIGVCA